MNESRMITVFRMSLGMDLVGMIIIMMMFDACLHLMDRVHLEFTALIVGNISAHLFCVGHGRVHHVLDDWVNHRHSFTEIVDLHGDLGLVGSLDDP